jgi:hypothetical protein
MTVTRTKPPQKQVVIWTKSENKEGIKAANIMRRTGAKVEVREIDSGKWKKSDVEAAVPGYTSLPQVVVDNSVIGNLAALKVHPDFIPRLKKPKLEHAERAVKTAENRTNWKTARAAAATERAVASNLVIKGRFSHATEEQKTAAIARAVAAKEARAAHAVARVAAVKAARPARG